MAPTSEITSDDYSLRFDSDTATVFCSGFLRLEGIAEYQPLMDLLLQAIETCPRLTVNLEGLEFLNSSGISMLSMFVVKVRGRDDVSLKLLGSAKILWQTKSLRNLQRLMPGLGLELI